MTGSWRGPSSIISAAERWASCFCARASIWERSSEEAGMKLEGDQKLLRIFIGEHDRFNGIPLYEAIVTEARALGMAGATVIKGFEGFGLKAHIHTAKLLE